MIQLMKKTAEGSGERRPNKRQPLRAPFLFGVQATVGKKSQLRKTQDPRTENGGVEPGKAVGQASAGNPIDEGRFGLADPQDVLKAICTIATHEILQFAR